MWCWARDSTVLGGLVEARGLSFFCDGCGDREVRCNGRSKLAPLRKASGIVWFWKGWFGMKNGGTIPPVIARILSGDSTSPLARGGNERPKLKAQSFARMQNRQSVH